MQPHVVPDGDAAARGLAARRAGRRSTRANARADAGRRRRSSIWSGIDAAHVVGLEDLGVDTAVMQPPPANASRSAAPACPRRLSGITRVSPRTGMKFVSPFQRGTTCMCTWSAKPGARDLAQVHADVEALRAVGAARAPQRALRERHQLARLRPVEVRAGRRRARRAPPSRGRCCRERRSASRSSGRRGGRSGPRRRRRAPAWSRRCSRSTSRPSCIRAARAPRVGSVANGGHPSDAVTQLPAGRQCRELRSAAGVCL